MRTQLRIVAGSLKNRKLSCSVHPKLRPTPEMVREALFSILGNAVPGRPFFDVFAGTGVVGLEALSRGAASTTFVERDFRLIADLERHVQQFAVKDQATLQRADVYRWVERWQPPHEPVNLFLSPPFADLERRADEFVRLVAELQGKLFPGSVLVLQGEESPALDELPAREQWEERRYGRNHLLFFVKEPEPSPPTPEQA
jgi:16S rRNA (guanine(966)-N(2))-methyltransferase RsmD